MAELINLAACEDCGAAAGTSCDDLCPSGNAAAPVECLACGGHGGFLVGRDRRGDPIVVDCADCDGTTWLGGAA